jgi:hypothetical protein
MDSIEIPQWGTAVTNLGRFDIPRKYGDLELERLIFQPGGGFPLVQVELVLGVVTVAGKMSLVLEYAEQVVSTDIMRQIKDKALDYLISEG